jgi:hypothetical protein
MIVPAKFIGRYRGAFLPRVGGYPSVKEVSVSAFASMAIPATYAPRSRVIMGAKVAQAFSAPIFAEYESEVRFRRSPVPFPFYVLAQSHVVPNGHRAIRGIEYLA